MKCLVCDFGGSSVKYALVNDNAEIDCSGRIPAPLDTLMHFVESIADLYKRFGKGADGIALSLPGAVDSGVGIHYGSGAYGSILKGINVRQIVSERCGVPVSLENDGKCGALAELWNGALTGVRDGAVLILGTGIGGGVITKGSIQQGANCFAGEFSYTVTEAGQYGILSQAWMNVGVLGMTYKLCKLKNIDLSEQDAGRLLIKYDALMKEYFPSFGEIPKKIKVNGEQIFRWVDEEDPDAVLVYSQALHSLAVMIHNLQLCYAPQRIILGGGLSRAARLLPDLKEELKKLYTACMVPPMAHANLHLSRYLDECNLLGAMYHFLVQQGGIVSVS